MPNKQYLLEKLQQLAKDEGAFQELLALFNERQGLKYELPEADDEKITEILPHSAEFYWSKTNSHDDEVYFVSPTAAGLCGYSAEEIQAMPQGFHSLVFHEDMRRIEKQLLEFEENPDKCHQVLLYRMLGKNQKLIHIKESLFCERDIAGKTTRLYGIVSDISEIKFNESEMTSKIRKLKELDVAKDNLISIVSHDLRAPYTSLLGFSEILLGEPNMPEAERQEYIGYIYEASKNQLELVNYLLDWSRLRSGKIQIELKRINVSMLLNNCIASHTGNAIRKNIELHFSISENFYIQADERLISQAINNLISNAIKFSPENTMVEIQVNYFNKGTIEFVVRDQGAGISEENQAKLFKIDQKFSTEGTKGEKGSGLGLTLVKEIIEKHGGEIWFYSEENKGSEFHFTIPEAGNSILLVEDDESMRILYRKLISKNFPGFEVIETHNGYEAISVLSERIPSLVITDHDMPLMNGIQLIESMYKGRKKLNIPFIVISAKFNDEVQEKYKKLGIANLLPKPVDLTLFIELIKKITT